MTCPGSVKLSRAGARLERSLEGAERGSRLHRAAFQGHGLEDLSRWERGAVDLVRELVARETEDADKVHVETRLVVVGITWGRADLIWRRGTAAGLVDAKFHPTGEPGEVGMVEQGRAYGLGLFDRWPGVETVDVVFVAPHGPLEFRYPMTRENASRHRARLKAAIARAEAADLDDPRSFVVTEYCTFCPALTRCGAVQAASGLV